MKSRVLTLPERMPTLPPDRGELLTADEVARKLLKGQVKAAWVKKHVPYVVRLGHRTLFWYEHDVLRWIAQRRSSEVA